uniref:Globin family profile domain-containing protein n=1 Tax=Panagrolaimus sp. JU765 TaxID=591449 RepID=A0AC34PZL9_9BILA
MSVMESGFRRTQSLRYPRGSTSSPSTNSVRRVRPSLRSKSSRGRPEGGASSLSRMTSTQKQALTSSWRILKSQAHPLMRKILTDLETASSKVKDIFYKAALVDCFVNKEPKRGATMDDHIKLLIQFFDDLIGLVDDETAAIAMIKHVGQQHAILNQTCAFHSDIWEQLGEIAMERLCQCDVISKTREAGRAWRSLIAFVTDELRCGFDGEARVYSRRNSSEQLSDADNEDLLKKLQQLRLDYTSTVPME